jgi:hypothetical protein
MAILDQLSDANKRIAELEAENAGLREKVTQLVNAAAEERKKSCVEGAEMSQELKPCPAIEGWERLTRFKPCTNGSEVGMQVAEDGDWLLLDHVRKHLTRSDAHLLRSHEALRQAAKFLVKNCTAEAYSPWAEALKLARAALTEAAAQKENGNG